MRGAMGTAISAFFLGGEEIAKAEHIAMKIETLSRVAQSWDVGI